MGTSVWTRTFESNHKRGISTRRRCYDETKAFLVTAESVWGLGNDQALPLWRIHPLRSLGFGVLAAINPKQFGDKNAVDAHALVAGVLNSQM